MILNGFSMNTNLIILMRRLSEFEYSHSIPTGSFFQASNLPGNMTKCHCCVFFKKTLKLNPYEEDI